MPIFSQMKTRRQGKSGKCTQLTSNPIQWTGLNIILHKIKLCYVWALCIGHLLGTQVSLPTEQNNYNYKMFIRLPNGCPVFLLTEGNDLAVRLKSLFFTLAQKLILPCEEQHLQQRWTDGAPLRTVLTRAWPERWTSASSGRRSNVPEHPEKQYIVEEKGKGKCVMSLPPFPCNLCCQKVLGISFLPHWFTSISIN